MRTSVGRIFVFFVLGLAVCVLMQTAIVNAKDPVTRPLHLSGQISIMDLYGGYPWTAHDQGVCSHVGKYVGVGKYPEGASGFGVTYTANGDQVFWRDLGGGTVEWTGGTGRFEGATGGFTWVPTSMDYVLGPEGTTTWVISYEGEGTITY